MDLDSRSSHRYSHVCDQVMNAAIVLIIGVLLLYLVYTGKARKVGEALFQ